MAFALKSANDREHMGPFLRQFRVHVLAQRVAVIDGSSFYQAVLTAAWPEADHQLCLF